MLGISREEIDYVNLTKIILHAELGQGVRPVGKPEQSFRSCLMNEFGISQSTWRSDCLNRNAWRAQLHIGKKSAMKQWLLREESKHIGRHDACNDHNVTRSKRTKRLLQEWTRSNRSRNLTQYLIYAAPTQSHTYRKVAEFKLAENWTNEGRSAGGSLSPDLMITATRREIRSMTAHMREVK
jgi:hypothetical protein